MIKYLTSDDLDDFLDLRKDSFTFDPGSFGGSEEELIDTSGFGARLDLPNDENFVLGHYEDEELVGMIGFVRGDKEKTRHSGEIWGFFVHPAYRKQGIGKKLLIECIKNAKVNSRIKLIYLGVTESSESAIDLYSKVGFHEYGRKPKAFKIGEEYLSEVQMFLEI